MRTLVLLRAGARQSHTLQEWMVHEFAPAQHASHRIVSLGVPAVLLKAIGLISCHCQGLLFHLHQ